MKKIICLLLLITFSSSYAEESQDEFLFKHPKVDLFLNIEEELKMEDLPDQSKFKIVDRKFKKYLDLGWDNDKKIMRLKPKRAGSTLIKIVDRKTEKILKQLRVFINKNDLDRVAKEIKSLLGNIEGIEIKVLNNKVVVDGQIILPSDMNRIVSVVMQYQKQAVSLVRLSPLASSKIASLIERDINNPEISVRIVNGFFILEGVARDLDERDEALRIAQAYVPADVAEFAANAPMPGSSIQRKKTISDGEFVLGRIINHLRIQPEPQRNPPKVIQIVTHFVELQKNYQRGFSFRWMPTIGDGTEYRYERSLAGTASTAGTITALINNLLPKLDWLREHGHARVLKSISLIIEDGNSGNFKSETLVPQIIQTPNGPSAGQPQPVGIDLTVKPQITGARSDIIGMDVNFTSGEILGSTLQGGALTSRNTVVTKVTVRSGQSAALGGLVTSRSSTDYNKLPAQAGEPLFKLFASKDFNRGQSQFVIFLTPIIKSSASTGVEKIKKKFRIDK